MQGVVKTLSVLFSGSLKSPKAKHPNLAATQDLKWASNPPRKILLPLLFLNLLFPIHYFSCPQQFPLFQGMFSYKETTHFLCYLLFSVPQFSLRESSNDVIPEGLFPSLLFKGQKVLSLHCLPLLSPEMEEQLFGTFDLGHIDSSLFFFAGVGDMRASFLTRKRVKLMFMGAHR